jgi:hypothetical protein
MVEIVISKSRFKKIVVGGGVLFAGAGFLFLMTGLAGRAPGGYFFSRATASLTDQPLAQKIYSLFECPCCGRPIDAECCDLAKERKEYVDSLVRGGGSEEDIVLAYVRKYGLDSFKDESKREEFERKLAQAAPARRPVISLAPAVRDLGNVSQEGGVVAVFFEVKNEGREDLVINRLETSCGCTSASIVFRGKEGPRFSMPGSSANEAAKGWQVTIPPGQTAQLKVYYDPEVHRGFRGAAVREIYVFSNDPVNLEKKVRIELKQVD